MSKTSVELTKTKTFIYDDESRMGIEDAKISLHWRIAEALETIAANSKITAQNFTQMADRHASANRRIVQLERELKSANRSNAALKGVITRLKNQND